MNDVNDRRNFKILVEIKNNIKLQKHDSTKNVLKLHKQNIYIYLFISFYCENNLIFCLPLYFMCRIMQI